MMNDFPAQLVMFNELLESNDCANEPALQQMAMTAALTGDPHFQQMFAERAMLVKAANMFDPYDFTNPSEAELGLLLDPWMQIILGRVLHTSNALTISLDDFLKHFLLLGRTGSGKTNFLYSLICQLAARGVAVWAFDRKQDFRHLHRVSNSIYVLPLAKSFPINPFAVPPGVDPLQWLQIIIQIFCKWFGLLDGSSSLLLVILHGLYEQRGIFEGSQNYPSMEDLFDACAGHSVRPGGREAHFKDSVLNRLRAILTTNGDIFDCTVGYSLLDLADKTVVFETAGLSENLFQFITSVLIRWLMEYRMASQERGGGPKNVIIADEGRGLFSGYSNDLIGVTPMAELLATVREFGIGMIISDQSAYLDNGVFANSYTKIAMSMGSGEDLRRIKKTFSLDEDQLAYFHRLQTGQAIVRHPRFANPFVIEILKFPLE